MENARALAVVEEALAIELSGVTRNREMNVLPAGLREVDTLKCRYQPISFVLRVVVLVRDDQAELDFARFVAAGDRPASGLCIRGVSGADSDHDARDDAANAENFSQSHERLLAEPAKPRKCPRSSGKSVCPNRGS